MNALAEVLVHTLDAQFNDFPYVNGREGMDMKVVLAREDEELLVVQFRARPHVRSGLHRHPKSVFGFTTRGAWSHEPDNFKYQPDSFICEPINELHRFINGPDVTEGYFISHGGSEYVDEATGEVVSRFGAADALTNYLQKCEAAKIPRPNILR